MKFYTENAISQRLEILVHNYSATTGTLIEDIN